MAFTSQQFSDNSLAATGELAAREFYRQRGWRILGRNLFNSRGKRAGEIDFVAMLEGVVCFVEVKTRLTGSDKFGTALEAVDYFKQKKLLTVVKLFLLHHPSFRHHRPQIDVCVVEFAFLDKPPVSVTIIPNAVSDELDR